ncbi:MAG: hypothetical protein DRH10_07735 [Deltaproteobacteria bacterium]|nr:MAG: hypothetical protein DRH10_07735 [Deltaproteobacteria bacterium]
MSELLTKTGVVKAVQGHMAVVVTTYEPECESCKAKETCTFLGGSGGNVEVKARNTVRAEVGDIVTISVPSSSVLKASFFVYMVPILGLICGILFGYLLAKLFTLNENLLVGSLAGIGLFSSFLWLKKKGDRLAETRQYIPEITSKQTPS